MRERLSMRLEKRKYLKRQSEFSQINKINSLSTIFTSVEMTILSEQKYKTK